MKIRKQENVDAFKERIIDTAEAIIKSEGMEKLSIRKITNQLNYTPGIVYHYFKNKDELISAIVAKGYGEIVEIIKNNQHEEATPSENLANTFRAYMKGMLARKELFLLLMNTQAPMVKQQVEILQPNISKSRASMHMLCAGIEKGIAVGEFQCENVELRAQIFWCSTYGVIERICKEQVEEVMQNMLIEEHIHMLLASIKK